MMAEAVTYYIKKKSTKPVRKTPNEGSQVLSMTIPASFKVTFGPLVPGSRSNGNEMAFRIYDGTKCRMLLRNVETFWSDAVTIIDSEGNTIDMATLDE